MDELFNAADNGDFKLFKQLESEIEEKDINWGECYEWAFQGGNFDIVKYCEEKGANPYTILDLGEVESTLEGWKTFMIRAAKNGDLDLLMWSELKIEEKYQCILGLNEFKIKIDKFGLFHIERDEDDFYVKEFGECYDDRDDVMNPLPTITFYSNFSVIKEYGHADLIAHGKEENKAKMVEFLRKVLKVARYGEIGKYLKHNLRYR
uniref:Ankyrin repeat protein n=1 Tax=Pithovirus LCPAC401 TaxID=2506595 RepID=A0A481Z9E0_9VIRU|nr:MAG: ankyrin repeat protein [Pithovirus LCPAC401]